MFTQEILYNRTKRWVIAISLLVHLLFLLLLLNHKRSSFFKVPQQKSLKQIHKHDTWASTRARNGAPILLVDGTNPIPPNQPPTPPWLN